MTKYFRMTRKEINVIKIMEKIKNKEIRIKEASRMLNKSERQIKRIKKRYLIEWEEWIMHRLRWRESNHKIDKDKYMKAMRIIKDEYHDYWPTLASERLRDKYNIVVNVSTLRREMIKANIWEAKENKEDKTKHFTARERKESKWEMIQYDWSYHKWFEMRWWWEYQCLLVAVDDATNELTVKFAKNEWLVETMKFWKEYTLENWKPQNIYLDKFATYKVNYPNATDDKELPTQFNRACKSIWIKLIFANTPQAKWRVERMNWTLQDRLVKALREENIQDIKIANKFLKEKFLPEFNAKFMVKSKSDSNLHMKLDQSEIETMNQVFSEHKTRIIQNDFTIRFENNFYQLFRSKEVKYTLKQWEKITIERHLDWSIKLSKAWIYILFNRSHKRPERMFKLLTAPFSQSSLDSMKSNILQKEKLEVKTSEEKQPSKYKSYFQKTNKNHPWMSNFNI